jgi:hypothetical protein
MRPTSTTAKTAPGMTVGCSSRRSAPSTLCADHMRTNIRIPPARPVAGITVNMLLEPRAGVAQTDRMGTAAITNRKYPRAGLEQPGVMTVRVPDQPLAQRIPVTIRSISPEGVGVQVDEKRLRLERRATVTMHFVVEGRQFEIPGSIAWVAPAANPQSRMDVGVHFQLALVPIGMRQSYANWIVSLLRRQGSPTVPPH